MVTGISALLLSQQKQLGMPRDVEAVRRAILETATPVHDSEDPTKTLRGNLNINAATEVVRSNRLPSGAALSEKVGPSAMPSGYPRPVFAIGRIDYDFGDDTVRDSFLGRAPATVHLQGMITYLRAHPDEARRLVWLLRVGPMPAYAIVPGGGYGADVFELFVDILGMQSAPGDDAVDRVSLPGMIGKGVTRIRSGESVPILQVAGPRGIHGWSTGPLVDAALAAAGVQPDTIRGPLGGFLTHIYNARKNLGQLRKDRALNFAGTNVVQAAWMFAHAVSAGFRFDALWVEKSPYCRPGSDCWDLCARFVDPENDHRADRLYRYTIDVSDLMPVTLGRLRSWPVSTPQKKR